MKNLTTFLILGLLASCGEKPTAPARPPLPVTIAKPSKREVTVYREFPATLEGMQKVEIRARVRGILSRADEELEFAGNQIAEGTPLFVIEPETYEQAVIAAQSAVEQAEAAETLARETNDRIKKAAEKNAVSATDVEVAKSKLNEATAAVSQAKAQLADAELTKSYTLIKAPVTGRISRQYVDDGNLVGSGESTLLATIIDDSRINAYFEVPERALIRYLAQRDVAKDKGPVYQAKIRLKLADGSIYDHTGTIDYIENEVDPQTRTARVRAVFPNPEFKLAAGLYGLIGYPAGPDPEDPEIKEALLVPTECVLRDIEGDFVWTVDDKNTVSRTKVTTGDMVQKPSEDPNVAPALETVVLSGLDGSENVIVSGLQRAREGALVTPQPAK